MSYFTKVGVRTPRVDVILVTHAMSAIHTLTARAHCFI